MRDAVAQIRSDLPQGILEPVISRLDVEGGALFHYAVRAPAKSLPELSWFIDDTVSRALLTAPGVQQVQRLGGIGREVRVALLPSDWKRSASRRDRSIRNWRIPTLTCPVAAPLSMGASGPSVPWAAPPV